MGGKFLEHLKAVFQVAHAGALVVSPGDRNLDDPIAVLDGDEQNLRVKAPVLDGLELKHSLRCPASECLEPHWVSAKGRSMMARVTALKQRPKNWR